jgi:hypothetical protein
VQSKDLIADVLPPPEYIIESYLVVHQLWGARDDRPAARNGKLRELYDQYRVAIDKVVELATERNATVEKHATNIIAFPHRAGGDAVGSCRVGAPAHDAHREEAHEAAEAPRTSRGWRRIWRRSRASSRTEPGLAPWRPARVK